MCRHGTRNAHTHRSTKLFVALTVIRRHARTHIHAHVRARSPVAAGAGAGTVAPSGFFGAFFFFPGVTAEAAAEAATAAGTLGATLARVTCCSTLAGPVASLEAAGKGGVSKQRGQNYMHKPQEVNSNVQTRGVKCEILE